MHPTEQDLLQERGAEQSRMIEQDLLGGEHRIGRQSCVNCRRGGQSRAGGVRFTGRGAEHAGKAEQYLLQERGAEQSRMSRLACWQSSIYSWREEQSMQGRLSSIYCNSETRRAGIMNTFESHMAYIIGRLNKITPSWSSKSS